MIINLQRNNTDDRAFTKSLTDISQKSGTFKQSSSIIDPVILFEGDVSEISGCNYMTIPAFSRSYFVTNIETIRSNLYQISGHCDVLSSFKDAILSNRAVIRRQENLWNLYLDDGSFKVYNNPGIYTKPFPSGFSGAGFVLAVAGSDVASPEPETQGGE